MAGLDAASLLEDVEPERPAGPNLEFDAAFIELERAAQGKPEQQFGDKIIPGEEPDWLVVEASATALLARTRDLRVLAHLAICRLATQGLPAYAEVTRAIRALLEQRWDVVHPQLDPEDDNDPTLRANALLRLADPVRVMRQLRDMPLVRSPRVGTVSWRDMAIAAGTIEGDPDRPKLGEAAIRGAFGEMDPARRDSLREAVAGTLADIVAIPAAFDRAAGPGSGPDFSELQKLLRDLQKLLERFAAREEPAMADDAQMSAAELATDTALSSAPARPGATGPVTSRAEAARLLDLVSAYYERYEPSSPLPLLLARAKRLAEMDFLQILEDLAPDGVNQAKHVTGKRDG